MTLSGAPVVAQVVRNGFVEGEHRGLAVLTDAAGAVEFAVGDPRTVILPRSSNKPLQAVASLRAGARLRDELLAIACSSHSGEAFHLDAVRALLASAGLTEEALLNTPDLPAGEAERVAWLRAGRPASSLAQNCSGKHAAMVAAAKASGWDVGSYLDADHPLQRLMRDTISELAGEAVPDVVVDGCGAPQHALPLVGLARAFGRLAAAQHGPERAVADAMRAYPQYVAGTGRDATDLMREVGGLIAKDGAEGVYAIGLPDGRGLAAKIVDGSNRARGPVVAELLRVAGVGSADARARLAFSPVLGHGQPVGAVVAVRLG